MPEESLPHRARQARKRHSELAKQLADSESGRADRFQDMREKLQSDQEEGAREVVDMLGAEVADLNRWMGEYKTVTEEFEMVATEAEVEGSKLHSEALKQQATFSGGAIVAVGTLTQVVLPDKLSLLPLLGITLVLLLYSICMSLLLMHYEAHRTQYMLRLGETTPQRGGWAGWTYWFTIASFPLGVVIFMWFLSVNL